MERLADDIEKKIIKDYSGAELDEVRKILIDYVKIGLNVGEEQFIRSILLITDGNKEKMIKELTECSDPRDIVFTGEILSGSNNHWMTIPFQELEILDEVLYQTKDLEENNSETYWKMLEDEYQNSSNL
ncbi:MAG: hypothetical protein J7F05_08930 [Trichodesmium erythraeum GBRTRLIN201]|nr:hypothetical protein [Trichodesmium erythraeum GBRTRLIN201]